MGFQEEVYKVGEQGPNYGLADILESGCRRLNLLFETEKFHNLDDILEWQRGGAETYITSGIIYYIDSHNSIRERRVLAKAYCGFSPYPEKKIELWQKRAYCLEQTRIPINKVYSSFQGVLFVEYLPWSLIDFLKSSRNTQKLEWAGSLLSDLANKLDYLKVYPVMLLADLRTDGTKIYITDFGEDLGDVPGKSTESLHCRKLLQKELVMHKFEELVHFYNKKLSTGQKFDI